MGQWGKAKCLRENPSNCQLPFLSFSPIIYFCQNVVELVIAWNGKSMGKNSNWAENHFFEFPKTYAILLYIHVFPFFLHSPSRWGFWEQLEFFLCFSFHVFGCWLHFSHGWEVVFVVLGIGLFFLTIWELLVHFPFTILSDPPHAQQAGSHLLLLPMISWNCCKFV